MTIEIVTPAFPESIQEGSIATWHKQAGEAVARDEVLVDVETDKVVLEVVAPADGVLSEICIAEGAVIYAGDVLARLEPGAAKAGAVAAGNNTTVEEQPEAGEIIASPAARKIADEAGIALHQIVGTGRGGRITKEDVMALKASGNTAPEVTKLVESVAAPASTSAPSLSSGVSSSGVSSSGASAGAAAEVAGERIERRVPMTRMRTRIAERLLEVTQTTAMLTTFNEVNMHNIMELRAQHKEQFAKVHNGTRLGFMGFFVKASTEALQRFPQVNASIDGSDIIYHGYQDIGVAVSSDRGLVVPVLRNAETLSMAEIENKIAEYGGRAKDGKLTMDEMTGGTFTITNGGVFGSLQSTPILNPPQAAILGMHAIKERPVAESGEVVIRPMMNLALSYDHRLIDGRDAVQFLMAIKEMIENPAKILLQI